MTATERIALTNALTAASAGPNPPSIERLRAAAEYIIKRVEPDQLILFGSASRGEFRDGSDFDFLAIRPPGPTSPRAVLHHWIHPETGDPMDAICETPEAAEERRRTLATPESVVFVEGATVYRKPGATPIRTLRDERVGYWTNHAVKPVLRFAVYECEQDDMTRDDRKVKWNPRKARTQVSEALDFLKNADRCAGDEAWAVGCKQLQESAERSLKGIIIASNKAFSPIRDLGQLWEEAREADGEIPLERHNRQLTNLSAYGRKAGYDEELRNWNQKELFEDFRPTAGELLEYADKRVRERLAEHELKNGTIPVRPSAAHAAETVGETAREPKTPTTGGGGDR